MQASPLAPHEPLADADLPLVTVAILAFNRRDELRTTLTKVTRRLDYPADLLEIIVVDNASSDDTLPMLAAEFPQVRVVANPRNEGIAGWNRAFAMGSGEWFLVLDDDCYVEGDALRRAVAAATAADADLVSFTVNSSDSGRTFSEYYRGGVLSFWGCSALISGRAVRKLGGFDPGIFVYSHELEFTMRLLDRGMTHLVLPEVSSVHMKPVPELNAAVYARTMRSFAYVAAKLMQPRDLVLAAGNLLLRPLATGMADRRAFGGLPAVVTGLREGWAVRAPVRPAVSRLYRRDHLEFISPLRQVRGPLQRLRDHRRGGPLVDGPQQFWDARPLLYPLRDALSFRVP